MRIRMCLPAVFSAVLLAQPTTTPRMPQFSELTAYLGLSDSQVTQLEQLRTTEQQTLRTVFQQIQAKETSLRQALSAPGATAAAVGQIVLDIQALRQQIAQADQTQNQQALALLTADQKTKLQALADAQKLQPDINQAERLGLLARPQGTGPGMMGAGPGMGMGARFGGSAFGRGPRGMAAPPPPNQ